MWHYDDGMGWWMIFGGLWMIVAWGIIIGLVIWAVRRIAERDESKPTRARSDEALEIAKERYARREMSTEEFEQIKRDLSS
jgi:putative membrane protein